MQTLPSLSPVHSRRPSVGVLSRLHDLAEEPSPLQPHFQSSSSTDSPVPKKSRSVRVSKAPQRRSSMTDQCLIRSFRCPISGRLMVDPVVTADGHSFEREAINDWFGRGHMKSPMTGAPLPNAELVPNHALRSAISEYMEELERSGEKQAVAALEGDTNELQPQHINYLASEVDKFKRECKLLTEQCEASELQRRALEADLSFLERRFTERARESMSQQKRGSDRQVQRSAFIGSTSNSVSSNSTGQGGMISQVEEFSEHLPPWLRQLAAIGADLEGKIHRFEKNASLHSGLDIEARSSQGSNVADTHGDAAQSTSNTGGVSAAGALGLRLLFEEELSVLAEEALRRAAVKRHHDRFMAATQNDRERGQETHTSLAAASGDALTIDCNLPLNPTWDIEASVITNPSTQHRRQRQNAKLLEIKSPNTGTAAAVSPSPVNEKDTSLAAQEGGLIALHEECSGTTWITRYGWGTESECGRWFGVSCDTISKEVVELRLSSNHLEGALPIQIGLLTSLVTLDLSCNGLHGPLPPQLAALGGSLRKLDLRDNALSGSLDGDLLASLGKRLTHLCLSWNHFTGPLPGSPKNSRTTPLSSPKNSSSLPSTSSSLHQPSSPGAVFASSLGYGTVSDVRDPWPEMRFMNSLDLSGNALHGWIPPSMGQLIHCQHLGLHFNRFSGPIPSEIADARGLRTLSLTENALTGRIPAVLGTLPKLKKLLLGCNRLQGRVPWELTNLSHTLTDLVLSDNPALQPDTPAARERRRCLLPNCRISL